MSSAPLRFIFAGTPEFAAGHLHYLLEHNAGQLVAVFTQPDRPAGRGKKLVASPVKELALAHGLPVYQPLTLRDQAVQEKLREMDADVMIVVAYGLILPQQVLVIPRHGCINVHASLLPRWRGAAPIQRAIESGDTETGITIMQMDEGLDTGDMLYTVRCRIDPADTAGTLHDKLLALGGPALLSVLQQINVRQLHPEPQNNTKSCYAAKITKAEAGIDWKLPAEMLERKIRAFNPYPITFFQLDHEPVRIWQAGATSHTTGAQPGMIINCDKTGITVATGNGSLLLQQLQLPGKKVMTAHELQNGHPGLFTTGKILH